MSYYKENLKQIRETFKTMREKGISIFQLRYENAKAAREKREILPRTYEVEFLEAIPEDVIEKYKELK